VAWGFKWESKLDFYYHLQSKGILKPDDVAPNVEPFHFYLDAFRELSSCRPGGFGISPIPFTAIVEYAKLYDVGEFHEFLDIIRSMDSELIRLESKSNKAPNTTGKKEDGRKTSPGNKGSH
jgi:hypothetical protein